MMQNSNFIPFSNHPIPLTLQENVSCLNTSLVILMLARRKAKLPFYLNALREKEYAEKYPGCLLNNFHNLLRFWQRHYLNKDKDSTCLENVSRSHCFLLAVKTCKYLYFTQDHNSCTSSRWASALYCLHLMFFFCLMYKSYICMSGKELQCACYKVSAEKQTCTTGLDANI